MTVEAAGADLLETVSYAHNDIDKALTDSLPTASPGSGLSDAITMGTPGVVADSNGFFTRKATTHRSLSPWTDRP